MSFQWKTVNPGGTQRILVTKMLPGEQWKDILVGNNYRLDICESREIVPREEIIQAMGSQCDAAIGQLTESWDAELFQALQQAGGKAYSNYAVGYDNVDVSAATAVGIPVGNTPGVLTETTAEMAVALTYSTARRVVEADGFMRSGKYNGWLPDLFLGQRLWRGTLGVIGAGRIGSAYARMMVQAEHMDLVYYDIHRNEQLEKEISDFGAYLESRGEEPVSVTRAESIEELLDVADVVSLHPVLNEKTRHLMTSERLAAMKDDAVLVNVSRGPVIDEVALVDHCNSHPNFRVGLDVFEDEPDMKPGLAELENVTIVPHIASATRWTREGMATLAACNIAGILEGYPVWDGDEIAPFLEAKPPQAAPSIVNARELDMDFGGSD
ncbi:MAG: D-glycerate dehydrogenase [Candidatus Marinimicrobia bacterium]|nr:D-glycerate dehydrogenase [Candidatus Neomarinimicrobiota bacterium]MCF7830064.1 D-glycerate dehydrogenase [Candidatus Neomarinimicrobiota bacterium]MCF7882365.1 D-glycerate dehydrogenase [Candidatus Neomarinimicrobiota bacterium]